MSIFVVERSRSSDGLRKSDLNDNFNENDNKLIFVLTRTLQTAIELNRFSVIILEGVAFECYKYLSYFNYKSGSVIPFYVEFFSFNGVK